MLPRVPGQAARAAPRAVLFDFDGTLADTAPDLAFAANMLRKAHGLASLPLAQYRPHVSRGGRGMVLVAFEKTPDDADYLALRDAFLVHYADRLCVDTRLFDGVAALLDALDRAKLAWGIVTNKATRYTQPIVQQMGLDRRTPCIVSGDTTPHAKPHPAPLLHAASLLGIAPNDCWYVGDDARDIEAARAAGMTSVVADWGYLGGSDPKTWNADLHAASPDALLTLIRHQCA
jgi:N-acetyl-D-muramate 6-phosphate phosphatase